MSEDLKVCAMCKISKPKSDFHTRNDRPCGVQSKCKSCMTEYKKKRYWGNHEAELSKLTKSRLKPENVLQRKEYYKKNKEEYIERYKKYCQDETKRERRTKVAQEFYQKGKEQIRERHKRNYERPENKERIRKKHHERKKVDITYVIKRRLRNRLRHIVKNMDGVKYESAVFLLGCDIATFKTHIENKFTDGMTWEGIIEGKIHMDHIRPCSSFNLTIIEDQKECFHFKNIQPLWAKDNLSKGDRFKNNTLC